MGPHLVGKLDRRFLGSSAAGGQVFGFHPLDRVLAGRTENGA